MKGKEGGLHGPVVGSPANKANTHAEAFRRPPSVWSMPSGDLQLIPSYPHVLTHRHTGSHTHGARHTGSHALPHTLPHAAHTLTHGLHTMHTHVPACGARSSIRCHVRHTHHTRLHTHAHTQNTHVLLQGTDVTLHVNSRELTAWRFCRVPLFTNASRPGRSASLCVGHGPPRASEKHC